MFNIYDRAQWFPTLGPTGAAEGWNYPQELEKAARRVIGRQFF